MTSIPAKTSSTLDKKDVQKLQRAIIDGLEDVKAQDIQVFDTEHITSLFERVIVASGTSNRQTKALAASVRDAVRDAGFAKPRIEGEENGEWIIVDCGAAVAHIMQPTIRQYYHLEELWGEKPIKLKLGAAAPLVKAAKAEPKAAEPKVVLKSRAGARSAAKPVKVVKPVRDHVEGYVGKLGKTSDWTAKRNEQAPVEEPAAKPARASRAAKPATKTVAKAAAKPAVKAAAKAVKTPLVKVPAPKSAAKKTVAAKVPAKKVPAKKVAVKAVAAKKPAARTTKTRGE